MKEALIGQINAEQARLAMRKSRNRKPSLPFRLETEGKNFASAKRQSVLIEQTFLVPQEIVVAESPVATRQKERKKSWKEKEVTTIPRTIDATLALLEKGAGIIEPIINLALEKGEAVKAKILGEGRKSSSPRERESRKRRRAIIGAVTVITPALAGCVPESEIAIVEELRIPTQTSQELEKPSPEPSATLEPSATPEPTATSEPTVIPIVVPEYPTFGVGGEYPEGLREMGTVLEQENNLREWLGHWSRGGVFHPETDELEFKYLYQPDENGNPIEDKIMVGLEAIKGDYAGYLIFRPLDLSKAEGQPAGSLPLVFQELPPETGEGGFTPDLDTMPLFIDITGLKGFIFDFERDTFFGQEEDGSFFYIDSRGYKVKMEPTPEPTPEPTATPLPTVEPTPELTAVPTPSLEGIILPVPIDAQDLSLSCESSASAMVAAYFQSAPPEGYSSWEQYFMNVIPKNCNPHRGFRGLISGGLSTSCNTEAGLGYGVYAEPVANAFQQAGFSAEVAYGVSYEWIADQIRNNRPVIVWVSGKDVTPEYETDPETGQEYVLYFGEHTWVVVGFEGEGAERRFLINDPWQGRHFRVRGFPRWNVFNNMSVAVGP